MVRKLSIQNFALIDELEISFSEGLTIITGETGAGKSILLGALSLLLGNRADQGSISDKTKKCVVEGEFAGVVKGWENFFTENNLDADDPVIIRREIAKDGKSRAFINDTPVTLNVLKEFGSKIIDIHSQHESLTLNNSGFQMMVIDSLSDTMNLLRSYVEKYQHHTDLVRKLKELRVKEAVAVAERDFLQFQFNELDGAGLKTGEQQQLESELEILNNSEEIKRALIAASDQLNGGESNLVAGITSVVSTLKSIRSFFPGADEIIKRLESANIEIKDIASTVESLEGGIVFNEERAGIITDRLDQLNHLQQKHRVGSSDELMRIHDDLSERLSEIGSLSNEISKMEKEEAALFKDLYQVASKISEARHKTVPAIEHSVKNLLENLGMKHARLNIDLKRLGGEELRPNGCDEVKFLFSANKGSEFRELEKVASGGELSRLMLCIKSLVAKSAGLPTIIFDEIDTGVSGEIAHKVGNIVKRLSNERQVIAITHLPQMAGKGDEHLLVYKKQTGNATATRIRKLSEPERVDEIAKMLSGESPSEAAKANARELLA